MLQLACAHTDNFLYMYRRIWYNVEFKKNLQIFFKLHKAKALLLQ
jgi:hypothetical protein